MDSVNSLTKPVFKEMLSVALELKVLFACAVVE